MKLKNSLADAQFSNEIAKRDQAACSSNKFKITDYDDGRTVWLNRPLFKDDHEKFQQKDKLSVRCFQPFIEKLINKNALKLELPAHTQIRRISQEKLRLQNR